MSTELRLTNEERRKVRDGSLRVIHRPIKPYPLEQGQKYIVSSTRRIRQIVDKEEGEVLEIPPAPNLWITVKGWTLKRVDDPVAETPMQWEITVAITDEREPIRRLSLGAPSAGGQPSGLKTRSGTQVTHRDGGVSVAEKEVPKKGEDREHWTPETERGYGGASTRDDNDEAVDDATLERYAREAEAENATARSDRRDEDVLALAEESRTAAASQGSILAMQAAERTAARARRRIEERRKAAA